MMKRRFSSDISRIGTYLNSIILHNRYMNENR